MSNAETAQITCAKCGYASPAAAGTCESCGAHLFVVCLECNRRVERTAHRCPHCYARLHGSRVKRELRNARWQAKRMGWLQITLIVIGVIGGFSLIVFLAELSFPKLFN